MRYWCKFFVGFLLYFGSISELRAQSIFMQIEMTIQQNRLLEAKALADQMMWQFLTDSTRRHAELWYLYGMVSEAIHKSDNQEFKNLQPDPLGHALYAYRTAIQLGDTLDNGMITKNSLIRLKALYTTAVNKGVEQHKAGRSEAALPHFWEANRIMPQDTLPLRYALTSSLATEKQTDIKKICYELLRLGYNKALIFQHLIAANSTATESENILYEAYALYPDNLAFRHFETNLRDKLGSTLSTIKKLEELHQKDSTNELYINNLITLNQRLFRWRETEKYYQKIYKLDSTRYDVVYQIGTYYYNEGLKAAYSKGISNYQKEGSPKASVYFRKALPYLLESQKFKNSDKIIAAINTAQADLQREKERKEAPKKKKNILPPPMDKPIIMGLDSPTVWTYDDFLEVKGMVLDQDGIFEVEINGVVATLLPADGFVARVPLAEGENLISVHAVDIQGLMSEHRFKVFRQNRQQLSVKNHLLVVGVERYEKLGEVKAAASAAQNFAEEVVKELDYFDNQQVTMLINENATQEKIAQSLLSYAASMNTNDNLLVYIAGKTFYDELQNESYLYTYESNIDPQTALKMSYFDDLLAKINAKHIFVITDAFYGSNKAFEQSGRSYFCQPNRFQSRYALSTKPIFNHPRVNMMGLDGTGFSEPNYPLADFFTTYIKSQKSPFSVYDLFLSSLMLPFSDRVFQLQRLSGQDEGGEWLFYKKP